MNCAHSRNCVIGRFERECFSDPERCRSVFADVYGTDLRKAVEAFQDEVQTS
jgi:hypothetical protein